MEIKNIKVTPIIFILLCLLAVLLFLRLWIGAGSFPEIWELESQINRQEQENQAQKTRNEKLEAEISGLGKDNSAIEDHARNELGMIKKNETFYQVILREDEPQKTLPIKPADTPEKTPSNN